VQETLLYFVYPFASTLHKPKKAKTVKRGKQPAEISDSEIEGSVKDVDEDNVLSESEECL